jgi:hypothetical protein
MSTQPQVVSSDIDAWNVIAEAEIVPLHATVISTEKESVSERLVKFEAEGLILAQRMTAALKVRDQESYNQAGELFLEGKSFIKDAGDFCEPIRLITYGLYQKVLDVKKRLLSPVEGNLQPLANEIKRFERVQEEKRQAEERRLAEELRRQEEERKLQAATAAEAVGMDEISVQEILSAPSTIPAPAAAPTFQRVAGMSSRENWCAEVVDFYALVKAVAKDKKLLPLLEANLPALNAQARSFKTALAIPGVRAVDKGSLVGRSR